MNTINLIERDTSCYPEDVSLVSCEIPLMELVFSGENDFNIKLESSVFNLFHKRFAASTCEISTRIKDELYLINHWGLAHVFLKLFELINWAKSNRISVGTGIGRLPCSLVSYILGITDIDPLKYNLYFERFLNSKQTNIPTICLEFCYNRRNEVIEYLESNIQFLYLDTTASHYINNKIPSNLNIDIFGSKILSRISSFIDAKMPDWSETLWGNIPSDDDTTLSRMLKRLQPQKQHLAEFVSEEIILNAEKNRELFYAILTTIKSFELYDYFPILMQQNKNLFYLNNHFPWESEILNNTCGYILYGEQIASIIQKVTNYSMESADQLMRELGKKNALVLLHERKLFLEASAKNGYKTEIADWLFDLLLANSAYAYLKTNTLCKVVNDYRLSYLEVHYPEMANIENTVTNSDTDA